jgi:hypothetical protein
VTFKLHSWFTRFHALALVASLRLGSCHGPFDFFAFFQHCHVELQIIAIIELLDCQLYLFQSSKLCMQSSFMFTKRKILKLDLLFFKLLTFHELFFFTHFISLTIYASNQITILHLVMYVINI